jgi:hypothetical protein
MHGQQNIKFFMGDILTYNYDICLGDWQKLSVRMAGVHTEISDIQILYRKTLVLGAFANLQKKKKTIICAMHVRQSTWNNSAPTGRIFMKFDISVFIENISRKFKFQ